MRSFFFSLKIKAYRSEKSTFEVFFFGASARSMVTKKGKRIIEKNSGRNGHQAVRTPRIDGNKKRNRLSKMRGKQIRMQTSLSARLEDQGQFELLEIADAPMEHLGTLGAGARAKVTGLKHGHRKPAHSRIAGDARANDTASDDQQVKFFFLQPGEMLHPGEDAHRA